jgi:hypothetical protein
VHVFSLLTNHFHLLVRSPRGLLSSSMRRVEDAYARWFNCRRGRDGHLFRGRFVSRLIEDPAYWETVVLYIDRNPVEAGMCRNPWEHPYGSARHYLRSKGPLWLKRSAVEEWAGRRPGTEWDPALYVRATDGRCTAGRLWIARRRTSTRPPGGRDPLNDLLDAAAPRVRQWLEESTRVADGTRAGHVLVSPETIRSRILVRRERDPSKRLLAGRKGWCLWDVLEAGSLRSFCGLQLREVEERLGLGLRAVRIRSDRHRDALARDPDYRVTAAEVLSESLAIDHPRAANGANASQAPSVFRIPASMRSTSGR